MMLYRMFTLLMLLVAHLATACDANTFSNMESIVGSGMIVTEARDVSDFSQVQIYLGANLALVQGNSESVRIEADDNLMSYIETDVQNGRLIVSTPDHINLAPSQTIQLYVTFDTLTALEVYGSSAITAEDLDLDELAISFSGSGSTHFTGTVEEQTITIWGQAIINNFDLTSQHVTATISGNGTLEVFAEDSLDITVAGMGNVLYMGNPTVTQNVSGVANIVHEQ